MTTTATESERHEARRGRAGGWLTTRDAAEQLGGCSEAHVRRLVDAKHLQAFNAAKPTSKRADWRFRQEWIDAYKAQRMALPKATRGAA